MKKYKTIGILGGMGPEATSSFYLRIINIFQEEYGAVYDDDFPEMIILNLPIPDVVENQKQENKVIEMLKNGAKKLENAGSELIAIPCNTVMCYIKEIRSEVECPVINILEETAKEIKKENLSKVGLIGTEATVNKGMCANIIKDVEIINLEARKQKEVTNIIMKILAGKKNDEDKEKLTNFIEELREMGAQKVILGCTELPLLIKNNLYAIDTLQVLAEATATSSLSGKYMENTQILKTLSEEDSP